MGRLRRKPCDGVACRDATFFGPARGPGAATPFFKSPAAAAGPAPAVQMDDAAPAKDDEHKDPLLDGLKTTGEKLAEHPQVKALSDAALEHMKLTLWDKASPADKAAMLTFLGMNLGIGSAAFASSPQLRQMLSGVNLGKPLGWIPYSPVSGFKYTLPEAAKTGTGLAADFTLNPYLGLLKQQHPGFPLTGATFGLEGQAGAAGKGFGLTGGSVGLDLFGGGLKAEGKTFKDPGLQAQPGYQVMVTADMLKLMPWLRKNF